jgi:hypothetical protein
MKLRLPFVWRPAYAAALAEVTQLNREATALGNDLSALRSSARGETQAHAHEVLRLKDQLNQAVALGAEKTREIATLRGLLAEKEQTLQTERKEAREERQKLMDWIAKGVSGGVPIFSEIPQPASTSDEADAKPKPGEERIPSDLEDAIRTVGRRPRAIVNHITKKKDADFVAAMAGAGVRRVFEEDRIDAEVEAAVISEQKSA